MATSPAYQAGIRAALKDYNVEKYALFGPAGMQAWKGIGGALKNTFLTKPINAYHGFKNIGNMHKVFQDTNDIMKMKSLWKAIPQVAPGMAKDLALPAAAIAGVGTLGYKALKPSNEPPKQTFGDIARNTFDKYNFRF